MASELVNTQNIILSVQMNIFCMVILGIIFIKIIKNGRNTQSEKYFLILLAFAVLYLFCDMLWQLMTGGFLFAGNIFIHNLINIVFYIGLEGVAYFWFLFSETIQGSSSVLTFRGRIGIAFPAMVYVVVILLSPWSHWIFWVNEQNQYCRGDFYFLQLLFVYLYPFFTCVKALVKAFRKENYAKRDKFLSLAGFMKAPILVGTLQIPFVGSNMIGIAITLSAFMYYIRTLELEVSVDPFTKMNNRNHMIEYLEGELKNTRRAKQLYFMFLDVDCFKMINDTYGHLEGDAAILMVSESIKKLCGRVGGYCARYGGDEFIVILHCKNDDDAEAFGKRVRENLKRRCEAAGKKYKLDISVGFARYPGGDVAIPDFIAMADSHLYREKDLHHKLLAKLVTR